MKQKMSKQRIPTWIWYVWPVLIVVVVILLRFPEADGIASQAGKQLYELHCQSCHMADGQGFGKLVPPLAGADYVLDGGPELACIIRYGMTGEVEVNGERYNRPMPAFGKLPAVEVRSILLYIRSAWGNQAPDLPFDQIRDALNRCAPVAIIDPVY